MDSMGHGGHGGGAAFIISSDTPLYSESWTPNSVGAYAGSCIFLIILASILRCLFAFRGVLEQRWLAQARNRRYVLVKGKGTEASKMEEDPASNKGVLTTNGVEERIRVLRTDARGTIPFRLSVDVPRAALVMVIVGVGYLV